MMDFSSPYWLSLNRKYRVKVRLEAINAYGGPQCSICSENRISTLTIDHIDGGGKQHRKSLNVGGNEFYRWLKRNNYPPGYRVLCMNCNHIQHLIQLDRQVKSNQISARSKRKRGLEIKMELMNRLGGICSCGIADIRILTIHHINGGGRKEHKLVGGSGINKFYQSLMKRDDLSEYECCCFNCNCAKDWEI